MKSDELEFRTKAFALRIVKFVGSLPKTKEADVLGYQLLRSGTSIGANYREARCAESTNDFIHKLGVIEKEANESRYWIELIDESDIGSPAERRALLREASQLLAIFIASGRTAKSNRRSRKSA
jgi:four helix bundle protein